MGFFREKYIIVVSLMARPDLTLCMIDRIENGVQAVRLRLSDVEG
jgi:hypothetical protein